jgi:hypothetical protein
LLLPCPALGNAGLTSTNEKLRAGHPPSTFLGEFVLFASGQAGAMKFEILTPEPTHGSAAGT